MTDGRREERAARRVVKSVLRPFRAAAGRFVLPTVVSQTAALHERIEAESADGTAALHERIEAVGRVAAESADGTAALHERIEVMRRDTKAEIANATGAGRAAAVTSDQRLRNYLMSHIELTRSRLAVPDDELIALEEFRSSGGYARIFEDPEPLVSVTVASYNRAELLVERCLKSIVAQDYTNLEIIVVGDGCTDDTEARVRAIGDDRITYVNLVDRVLPAWVTRGTEALNLARSLATGDLLTHLDDDDEYEPDRIGRLVRFLQDSRVEFVWHPFWWQESADAEWSVNDADALEHAKVTSGSVLYLGWFRRVRWDMLARRDDQPDDWVLIRTLRDLGIKARRYPVPLLRHYLERQNPRRKEASQDELSLMNASALRRTMPLVPEVASSSEYDLLLGQVSPWLRAVTEIGARAGISAKGPLSLRIGEDFPTLTTARGHVVTLYGQWRDGPKAFDHDIWALETAAHVAGVQVPKLLASGPLAGDWSFIVTSEIPGVPMSTVRDELSSANVDDIVPWLAGVVRDLHATPLSVEDRVHGWDAFGALIAECHASTPKTLAERGTLAPHLLSQIEDWLPPLSDLLPPEDVAVMLHGHLFDEDVLGVWHAGRFDPTGLVDLRHAQIGHPFHELGALYRGVLRGDTALLRVFVREMAWPEADWPDFPKLALAFVLLSGADPLHGLSVVDEARDLDDLAARLFGEATRDPATSVETTGANHQPEGERTGRRGRPR
jgi:hypothetical protein